MLHDIRDRSKESNILAVGIILSRQFEIQTYINFTCMLGFTYFFMILYFFYVNALSCTILKLGEVRIPHISTEDYCLKLTFLMYDDTDL